MSEFTLGALARSRDAEMVTAGLTGTGLVFKRRDLNTDWTAFLLADEWDEEIRDQALASASQQAPVLWFEHGGDHGWSYAIWQGGARATGLAIDYEIDYRLAQTRFQALYPDEDPFEGEQQFTKWSAVYKEVDESAELLAATRAQYLEADPGAFATFGLSADQLTQLTDLLTPDDAALRDLFGPVKRFQAILGITEMQWLSYRYAEDESDYSGPWAPK